MKNIRHFKISINEVWKHFLSDSLFQNSVYLMLATLMMSGLGFFFWIINARLFTIDQVGIATTIISVVTLISGLSQLGLGNSLIKYLPNSERKDEKINTTFTLIIGSSIVGGIVFLTFLPRFSPPLIFIKENNVYWILFIIMTTFASLNIVSDNIFIAYRTSMFVFIKNTIFSLVKLILPIFLISYGAYGIFAAFGIASGVSYLFGLYLLNLKTKYRFKLLINFEIVKRMSRFSLGNYIAVFIGNFPTLILPILITNIIGSKFAAYYFVDIMIANLLYVIPGAITQSLYAEGSHDQSGINDYINKAFKLIFMVTIPAVLVVTFFGSHILSVFGKQYSTEGTSLLQILAINGLFVSISLVGEAVMKLKHKIRTLLFVNLLYTATSLLLSFWLAKFGLIGVGVSLLIGSIVACGVYFIIWDTN